MNNRNDELDELLSASKSDGNLSQEELDDLVEKRLLHVIVRDNSSWIEFSHDILAPVARIGREKRHQKRAWEAMQKAYAQEKEEMQEKLKLQRNRVRKISILLVCVLIFMGLVVFFSWFFYNK